MEVVEYSALARMDREAKERAVAALSRSGMLAVRDVPGLESLRRELLPMAQVLALMPDADRRPALKRNGLGTDVSFKRPDRLVSSFATQLAFGKESDQAVAKTGLTFRQLGRKLIEVGLLVSRVCDSSMPGLELEKTILDSQTAKGRLIHYHSENERSVSTTAKQSGTGTDSILWQQWHYDYGILTVVTSPLFLRPGQDDASSPSGHSSLLALDSSTGTSRFLDIPEDCLLVQVGEAAQILSSGRLRATAHCVVNPVHDKQVSRETFVVFLQPAWSKALAPLSGSEIRVGTCEGNETRAICCRNEQGSGWQWLLDGIIPPLDSRWKAGWTFAEFSKETTKRYYGSCGVQSSKK